MHKRFTTSAPVVLALLVAVILGFAPSFSSAFVPEDLDQLKKQKKCPGCDLRAADLHGADLADVNLEGANLMGANLEGAILTDATLEDASLEKANLKNADLHGASLDHAAVDGTDFKGADMQDMTWIDGKVCKKGSIGICK